MADIQELEARALALGYAQSVLFADLAGQKQRGSEVTATCPFCGREGKFAYNTEKPVCHCWVSGCQAESGLNWYGYAEARYGWSFPDYLRSLSQFTGLEVSGSDRQAYEKYQRKADILEAAQAVFVETLSQPAGEHVLSYLLERGYTREEIGSMGLGAYTGQRALESVLREKGYTRQDLQATGLFTKGFGESHQLTLLWRDLSGRPVGLVARSLLSHEELKAQGIGDKYKYSFGFSRSQGLLGLERARREKRAILVEGPLDALLLAAHDLPVASTGGTSLSSEQVRALESAGVKELLIAFDQDAAGRAGTEKVIQRLLASSSIRPYVVAWEDGYKDPDDLILKGFSSDHAAGLEYFQGCLKHAEGWQSWLARSLVSRHELMTDSGRDAALEEALSFYVGIADPVAARPYREALEELFALEPGDLNYQIAQYRQRAADQRARTRLQRLQSDLAGKVAEGDLAGAEQALEEGLQDYRRARGAAAPEPYLLADFEHDLITMTDGLSTGYQTLETIRIPEGAITIIAGRPGHGKTTLQLNLLWNLLYQYGEHKRFYFYSYEESRSRLLLKLLMLLAGEVLSPEQNQGAYLNYLRFKRDKQDQQNDKIERAYQMLGRLTASGRLWLQDRALPAEDLAASIDDLAGRGDIGAVFVDYIQKVPVREARPTRQAEIARASEMLREVAVRHNIPLIMGAQFNRQAGTEPKLEHLREAGDIEQDASLVISLYNKAEEEAQESGSKTRPQTTDLKLSVLKHRGGPAGGQYLLMFNAPALRISDKAGGSRW